MKPDTFIILTPGFPENEADSTCVPPQQIFVKALKEQYPQLNLVVLTLQYPFFSDAYEWHGIKVISFGSRYHGRIFKAPVNFRVQLTLKRLHQKYNIIGLLSFWFGKCAYIANNFAKRNGLVHYSWILGQDAKAGNKYFKKIRTNSETLIALSDFIVREFGKNCGVTPKHIIPVGIDTALFDDEAVERDIDILGAGSLIPLKQYDVFLEMINSLVFFFPKISAVICGGGPELAALRASAKKMDIENNITFLGIQPHDKVLRLMQRSKIFLHPSSYEGFGAVCLEALYAGAHVVSFVKPMNTTTRNWHTVTCKEDMFCMLKKKLQSRNLSHEAVLPYPIEANVKAMMALFNNSSRFLSKI